MADASKTAPTTDPTEPKLVEAETKLATNPVDKPELEAADNKEASTTESKTSVTDMASNAASSASAAAAGVKDSVFSMFGGGAKKEKKPEEEDEEAKNEPSGSSKAQKKDDDAEEVRVSCNLSVRTLSLRLLLSSFALLYCRILTLKLCNRKLNKAKILISSLSYTSQRRLKPRLMKKRKIKLSRCARSYSNSTETPENGRNEVLVMSGYSNIKRTTRLDWS